MRKTRTTNPELIGVINLLKKQSRENSVHIWRDIAERLTRSRRNSISINVSRLNMYTRKGETIVVPGKVLGTGTISHPITVAAFNFSKRGKEKIESARGKCLSLADLVKKHPKGSKIRIIG